MGEEVERPVGQVELYFYSVLGGILLILIAFLIFTFALTDGAALLLTRFDRRALN